MIHAYTPFFITSLICIIMIAAGIISEVLSYKAGKDWSGGAGLAVICLIVLVLVQLAFGTMRSSGEISRAEASYYILLWEHNEYLQIKYLEAGPEAKKAYEKEIDRNIKQIEHEQKYMSYKDWDAYYKILEENAYGNRDEGTLPGRPDTESFQKQAR